MNYTKEDLRLFSFLFTVILGLFSVKFCKADNVAIGGMFLAASLIAFLIGIFMPILILPIYKALLFIAKIIGFIVTNLLLSFIFYCVFTPIGVILRVIKKDILGLRIDKNKPSYWIERKERYIKPESLQRQF